MTDPAPLKEQVYKDPRPAETFTKFHERVRNHPPSGAYEVTRVIVTWLWLAIYRVRAVDKQNVPLEGPVIIVPNHFSFIDHFYVGFYLRRKMQYMAKSQLFKFPLTSLFYWAGVFPIRRGYRDEEAFTTANSILSRGGVVLMYAEGGRSRTADLGEPRSGVGRLALESGVPVVPTALYGAQRSRNWKRGEFPQVTVRFGAPIRFDRVHEPTREQQQAASELIFERVRQMFGEMREADSK